MTDERVPAIVPISDAKARLTQLIDQTATEDVILTRRGYAAAVLISMDRYNALMKGK